MFESWEDCSRREVEEEVGIKIQNIRFGIVTNDFFLKEKRHYITICMVADYESGDVRVMEPEKCSEWGWFEWNNLPFPLFQPIKNQLKIGFNPFL